MTEYDIHIKGVKDGLTANALEEITQSMYPDAESVEVVESQSTDN